MIHPMFLRVYTLHYLHPEQLKATPKVNPNVVATSHPYEERTLTGLQTKDATSSEGGLNIRIRVCYNFSLRVNQILMV